MLLSSRLALVGCLIVTVLFPREKAASADDQRPWWMDYHTLVSHSAQKVGQEWALGMMAERGAWATGWYGAWWIEHQLK